MSYIETAPGVNPNQGRINNNITARSLAVSFYGDTPPVSFTTIDGSDGPFPGMLWNSSNTAAPGVYMYVPGSQSGSHHGDDWTRIGIGNRKEDSYAQLVQNVSNGYYEVGELVAVINSDTNLTANNSLYFITSNTRNESAIVDVLTSSLSDDSVTSVHIAPDAIDSSKIQDGAIITVTIRDAAVTTIKIANEAGTTDKIANRAATGPKIALRAVDTEHIEDDAVDTPQIAADAVENEQIADDAVDTPQLADAAVTNPKVEDGTLQGAKVVENGIGTRELDVEGPGEAGQILTSNGANQPMIWEDAQVFEEFTYTIAANSNINLSNVPADIWRAEFEFNVTKTDGLHNTVILLPLSNNTPISSGGNAPIDSGPLVDSRNIPIRVTRFRRENNLLQLRFQRGQNPGYIDIRKTESGLINFSNFNGLILGQFRDQYFSGFRGGSVRFENDTANGNLNGMGNMTGNVHVRIWKDLV